MSDIIYLDICCLKRPFDDASAERVRHEAEAVAAIMRAAELGRLQIVRSPAHDVENERNPREDRRLATSIWLKTATVRATLSADIANRGRALTAMGFTPLDALHLAFAESSSATCFLTTDDRLLKRARACREQIGVRVLRPDEFVLPTEGDGE